MRAHLTVQKEASPPDSSFSLQRAGLNNLSSKTRKVRKKRSMDSPLLEHRTCPTCPGLIAGADPACPDVPPLDESLAAHLLPQAAGWAERKKPLPPLPQDRDTLEYLDKMFRLWAQMVAAVNNLGVLGVSLITPQTDTKGTEAIIRTAASVR